ncbi:hypothetical protein [uncultured Corynebacterium sp.]|uniref:DoxX family protein n=1 Tax=uncultured Corynebacterium sp. TaxID=159447 RepID=UPI0025E90484|nr:hypothetical protein [uncultured Corynebacterium sp.]
MSSTLKRSPKSPVPEWVRRAVVVAPLATVGTLHFPPKTAKVVDRLIPDFLPGPKRAWTVGSGVLEVGTAAALMIPATRRPAAVVATGLLTALWVGNIKMAWDWRDKSPKSKAIAYGRLPMQIPLIAAAWSLR